MSSSPLYVAFLWHMHQPYYKDPFSGVYRLPWVRLHGTKDYLDMVSTLEEYPDIRQTFNLVPSLIEQVLDYTLHGATDAFLDITLKRAADLSDAERMFILENFFLANWETMIKPFPRFYELLAKRGFRFSKGDLSRIIKYFSNQDFLDLQVLFNLTWVDPLFRDSDATMTELVRKGKDYSEDEKGLLMERHLSILKGIIPKYREMSDKGQIELSTTPFYHPILPLLWDTDVAKIPTPDIRLPKRRFSYPEDARYQIESGLDYFRKIFGRRPAGMWPSEGAVSEDIAREFRSAGVNWIATDEDILAGSLGEVLRTPSGALRDPAYLYSVHEFSGLSLIFRDHKISDLLGFVYSGWDPKRAAEDLIGRFVQIHDSLPPHEPHIVPVILDGENAWEHYRSDGHDFFRYLYEGLSENERIRTTTISDFLSLGPAKRTLHHLRAGSWIYGNFSVWIGHEEDNTAWDYLTETRESLDAYQKRYPTKAMDEAWKSLHIAEGSDWNWWYGDEHSTETATEFDELFRFNLMKVYRKMGKEVPAYLTVPVLREDRATIPSMDIRGFIHPRIDGIMTSYFEWYQAAYIDVGRSGGSMHMSESLIARIYYGFNQDNLFIRVDPKVPFAEFPDSSVISVDIIKPSAFRISVQVRGGTSARLMSRHDNEWVEERVISEVALGDILECTIPFADIKAKVHDELNISLSVSTDGEDIERCPWRGHITVTVPTPDFEAMMWH